MIKRIMIGVFIMMIGISLTGCKPTPVEETTTFVVDFDTDHDLELDSVVVESGSSITLTTLSREGYDFLGWALTSSEDAEVIDETFTPESDTTLYARWYVVDWTEVEDFVTSLIPETISDDLSLEMVYEEFSIVWTSSHPEILSDAGMYNRPYHSTTITMSAQIQVGNHTLTKTFEVETGSYKSLDAPLTSSYIYRDYHAVTDSFFETLDIINCAFITADEFGILTGVSVLNNINTYIMPKAKEHGNWVIFSVAPSSEWSEIAASPYRINTFADNIVAMINEYGFDGVDIDWETPLPSEATAFTEMMEVIYTKVKANNPNHLVTAAIAGGMWQPQRYDLENSLQYLDYINMMTYGMVNNNGYYQNALSKSTIYDNPLNLAGRTLTSCSIEESIEIYHSYGVPNSKIIVGVAFYGIKQIRSYDETSQTWSNWTKDSSVSFTYISNFYLNSDDYRYYYDNDAGVPYIMKNDGTVFISYDNPRSIAAKSEYIIENGLAGMMYWENGLDLSGSLLLAMDSGLND